MLWPLRLIANVVVPLPDAFGLLAILEHPARGCIRRADARELHINSSVMFSVPVCLFEGVGVLYTAVSLRGYVFTVLNVRRNKTSECRVQRCGLENRKNKKGKNEFQYILMC